MKSHFAIFGLERIALPDPKDDKSGQPYMFRKYPKQFDTKPEAISELQEIIMKGNSPFIHFKFNRYEIHEVLSASF
ncbi:MAG: hypothetical protein ABIY62_04455 [Ginsengibacter sp.]